MWRKLIPHSLKPFTWLLPLLFSEGQSHCTGLHLYCGFWAICFKGFAWILLPAFGLWHDGRGGQAWPAAGFLMETVTPAGHSNPFPCHSDLILKCVLISLAPTLTPSLPLLFNLSLSSGPFLLQHKPAFGSPILKKPTLWPQLPLYFPSPFHL